MTVAGVYSVNGYMCLLSVVFILLFPYTPSQSDGALFNGNVMGYYSGLCWLISVAPNIRKGLGRRAILGLIC